MKKGIFKFHLVFFTILSSLYSFSQNQADTKEKISKSVSDYFSLERENIHIQLNKNTYLSNESVWFKGYVFNRKDKVPFFYTTNVYAVLYDENGNKLTNKLLYSNAGCFSGKLQLDNSYKTGKYFLHFYTNWMNNFKEDESAIFEFSVINKADKTYTSAILPDYSAVNIEFSPEGGAVIDGVLNTIGIKISDCNKNPIPVTEVEIINSQGDFIQKVPVNKFGFGKFQLLADGKVYKATFSANNQKFEDLIPVGLPVGISLEINSYTFKDKTIAIIKTNKKGLEKYKNKPLFLVIHQDNKTSILDFNFDNNSIEQKLFFSNTNLFDGVNTIRIIDSDLKQLAERSVFKYPENKLALTLESPKKLKESYEVKGKFSQQFASASISILPEKAINSDFGQDIFGSILINPYFEKSKIDASYYFTDISRLKHYDLDLLLLNQKESKYKWENITGTPPKIVHDFDIGLTIKGTLNQQIGDRKNYKVQLYSLTAQLDEATEITEKGEFYFKNMVVPDSTWVNFTLMNKDKTTPLKVYPQLVNLNRTFNKPFKTEKTICTPIVKNELFELPELNNGAITLDDVEIEIDKKKLKYKGQLGNGNLKGYKITDDDPSINMDLITYIRMNGFEVETRMGEVFIYSRTTASLNGARNSPAVYVSGNLQMDFNYIQTMRMHDIDEIYINAHAANAGMVNTLGIIKIYLRTGFAASNKKNTSIAFEIKNAFSKIESFKNSDYAITSDKGFQNFGVINWIPSIITQENGEFKFSIPNMDQKKVKLLIEGFSADGNLISEIRTIELP